MPIIEQQSPDPLDVGECLIATVGLTRILKGDMPKVGVMLQRECLDLPNTIIKIAQQMVNDQLPRRLRMPRDWKYDQLLELFSNPIPEQAIENILVKFPPEQGDMAASFMNKLATIHKQLADIVPVMQYQTCLGPVNITPTGDKLFRFFNQYWVLSNPLIVFTLAQSGALLPEQVNVLTEFYPSLYEQFKSATLQATVKYKMAHAKFLDMAPRISMGVNTLLQNKVVPYGSNQRLAVDDRSMGQPDNSPGPNPVANEPISNSLQSPAQKASSIT